MSRWPDNEVWEPKDSFNRAPRPALTECEPIRHRGQCARFVRWSVKAFLYGGFFLVVMVALFWWAR